MASINPTYLKDIEIIIYVSTIQIYQSDLSVKSISELAETFYLHFRQTI